MQQPPSIKNDASIFGTGQQRVPKSIGVFVLGIVAISHCWIYGLPGIICGAIAMSMARKGLYAYNLNPDEYTEKSYKQLKTGKTLALWGIILGVLFFILWIALYAAIIYFAMESSRRYERYY